MNKVRVFAPATVANMGCGFDIMGMTLDGVGDVLSVEVVEGTIDDCGFYYSTSKASVMNNKVTPVPGGCSYGTIQGEIVGLSPNTTYYIKAYGMNEKGQGQTEVKQVRTFSRKPNMEDNQYPDKVE